MPSMDRAGAERRVRQIRAFRAELDALKLAGRPPFTLEQERAIIAYHDELTRRLAAQFDVDTTEAAARLSRGMQLLSLFGAAALTAALYSLVSHFWGRLDLPLQATLLAGFPLAALAGVELAARRERTLYISSLFALVACGTFWVAVDVLSRTLNIPVMPVVLWIGAAFGLTLALSYGFRALLALSLLPLIVAPAASLFQIAGVPWTEVIARPELLVVTAFSLTWVAPLLAQRERGFDMTTRLVGFGAGLLGVLYLSFEGHASLLPLPARGSEIVYRIVMLLASVALMVAGVRRGWHETVYASAALLALFLLLHFVDWFWEALPRFAFYLTLAVVAFGWLLLLRLLRARLAPTPGGDR